MMASPSCHPIPNRSARTDGDVVVNGRAIGREWRENVQAKGEYTMFYD